jgi:hypothetical protein
MTGQATTTEKIERLYLALNPEQQHNFTVMLHLMVNDPEVQKLDAAGLSDLCQSQRLSQKPGEADAA